MTLSIDLAICTKVKISMLNSLGVYQCTKLTKAPPLWSFHSIKERKTNNNPNNPILECGVMQKKRTDHGTGNDRGRVAILTGSLGQASFRTCYLNRLE